MRRNIFLGLWVVILFAVPVIAAPAAPATTETPPDETASAQQPPTPIKEEAAPQDASQDTAKSEPADKEKPSPDSEGAQTMALSGGGGGSDLLGVSQKIDVDPITGTATASVPIAVPPGRGGIQPQVALVYASGSSQGNAGLGWNLDFGSIQRSTKRGVPKYDGTDTFVLTQSGSQTELVDVSGGGQTDFRPKIEGAFNKIQFVNGAYWLVTDKKGTKYFFGQTDVSRAYDPNDSARRFKYLLDRVEDVNGNYLTFTYHHDGNEVYPLTADYTGNTGGLAPFAQVGFVYEPRPDQQYHYSAGWKTSVRLRAQRINVSVGGALQRRYELTYSQDAVTSQSLLATVRQLGSDGTTALPDTVFTYSATESDFNAAVSLGVFGTYFADSNLIHLLDMNSDGKADILRTHPGTNDNYSIYINNSQGGSVSFASSFLAVNPPPVGTDTPNLRFVDLNGDGVLDIIRSSGGTYTAHINNGTNGFLAPLTIGDHPPYDLSNQLVQFVDMTGDGLLDALEGVGGNYKIYPNIGGNFTQAVTAVNSPSSGTDSPSVRLADINGDGVLDVVRSQSGSYTVWVNNRVNGFLAPFDIGNHSTFDLSSGRVQFADMNGDGLTDMLEGNPGAYNLYVNIGGNFTALVSMPNPPAYGTDNANTKLIDANNDGLTDVLYGSDTQGGWWLSLNAGGGEFKPAVALAQHPSGTLDDANLMLADADGEAKPDMVYGGPSSTQVWLSNKDPRSSRGGVLVKIDNSVGGSTEIEYGAAVVKGILGNQYKITFNPVLFPTVKTSTARTAFGDSYATTYKFTGGLWNAPNREFRGFATARVTDPQGSYAETTFAQDDIFKGRPQEQATYNSAGNLFAKTANTWSSQVVNTGVTFAFLLQTDNYVYDGNSTGRRTQEKYTYGETTQLGNLTKVEQLGEVDLTTGNDVGSDKRTVETVYSNNTSSGKYLIGFPQTTTVKDNAGALARQTWFYYDGATSETTLPVTGLLTQKKDWGGSGGGAVHPITKYTYDAYGNLATTIDPRNNTTTITYDTALKLFPLTVQNALTHQVVNEYYGVNGVPLDSGDGYRGLFGQMKSTTDPNNQTAKSTYDVLGRVTKTVGPLDSISLPTSETLYTYTSTYVKVTGKQRIVSNQSATIDTYQFSDGLGRLIQAKTPTETAGTYSVTGQTTYNSRGLPEKKFLPFASTNSVDTIETINLGRPYSTMSYDAMGRLIQSTSPDGSYATASYDDWTATAIDENGHQQKSYFDAYGRLKTKEEYTGADGRSPNYQAAAFTLYATTQYAYDSEGNLKTTTDAVGNVTTINYDTLGRKTNMQDPDMGYWQYTYDAAGNLATQTDAKAKVLNFTYDALNRLTYKQDAGTMGGLVNVNYTYDDAAMTFGKGRLTKSAYLPTGANTQFNYDELGREKKSVKVIDGVNYTVERGYDALSRLTNVKYPDGKQINYTYNASGAIETLALGSATVNWEVVYDSTPNDYLPDSAGQPNNWTKSSSGSPAPTAVVESDANCPDGKRLNVDTTAGSTKKLSYSHASTGQKWKDAVNNANGYTIEARLKVVTSGTTEAASFVIKDGSKYYKLQFRTDRIIAVNLSGGDQTYMMNTTSAYHAYRISVQGTALKVFVDDVLRLTGTLNFGSSVKSLVWGDDSIATSTGGNVHWDYVKYTTADNYEPVVPATFVSNVDYNAAGQITQIVYGNGNTTTYTYNAQTLRLSRILTQGGAGTVQDLNYTYDSLGNILTIVDNVNTADQTFTYDALNRLITANGSYGNKVYAYDQIGNLTQKDGLTYTYGQNGYGKHAVTSLSDGTTFTYDANGNMATRVKAGVTTQYIYDLENRLTEVKKQSVSQVKYYYDGDGGRVKKIHYVGGNPVPVLVSDTTRYVGALYEKTDSGRETDYIYLGDQRVASVTNGQVYYYHADHLGGTNVLTNSTGVVKEITEYDPYGKISRNDHLGTAEEVAWYYFTSKGFDGEVGLYYYGARYYDPVLGRFITADTVVQSPSNPQTLNRYSYCGNNPVNLVDANGHWFWVALIVGAILGGASAAVNDQPIWQGVLLGAASGVFVGAGASAFGFWGAVGGGMLGGALNGAVNGGNIGISALSGGLGAGLGYGLGSWASGWNSSSFWGELGAAVFAGSVSSGVGAELSGGRFGEGAWRGAAFSSAGFLTANAVSNLDPRIRNAKRYEQESKKLHDLNVKKNDMVKKDVTSRQVVGPAGHETIDGIEMGPNGQEGLIRTSSTVEDIMNWNTRRHTQEAIQSGSFRAVSVEVSASGLVEAVALYEQYWVKTDTQYSPISYNSNYAVNTIIYSAGGSVPGGLGWNPPFGTVPTTIYHPYRYREN